MHKKIKRLVLYFILPVLVTSCITPVDNPNDPNNPNPVDPNNPNSGAEAIPLSIGSQWAYHLTTPAYEEDQFYRIYDVTPYTIGSSIYPVYLMEGPVTPNQLSLFLESPIIGFYKTDSGVNNLKAYNTEEIRTLLWFKYPCSEGDTYDNYTVESTSVTVTSDYMGASFNCIKYDKDESGYISSYYVFPGIGIIKAELSNGTIIFELTGYTIN